MINLATATDAMLECAIWASTDFDGEPLTGTLSPETARILTEDLVDFIEGNLDDIEASGLDAAQIGHDFWLTRNHHGAGFWDRGIGEIGERLTKAAHPFGTVDLYIGDDGLIYA